MRLLPWMKKIAIGCITAGSTLLIAACYGVYDESYRIRGTVRLNGDGVEGIQVCAESDGYTACAVTDYTGYFSMDTTNRSYYDNGFSICVEDVDGDLNGRIRNECLQIPAGEDDPLNVDFTVHEE
ncbi:hypothetical protein KKF84_06045 [Myxococcota bacterium]|nr:hypothetical protein [Myxococcota bacterium]MBU1534860.1 hypothetical protein [Myxococcota bacterium]